MVVEVAVEVEVAVADMVEVEDMVVEVEVEDTKVGATGIVLAGNWEADMEGTGTGGLCLEWAPMR